MTDLDIQSLTGSAAKVVMAFLIVRGNMTTRDLYKFTGIDRKALIQALRELKTIVGEYTGSHGLKYWHPNEDFLQSIPEDLFRGLFPGIQVYVGPPPVKLPSMHPKRKIPIPQSIRIAVFTRDNFTCLRCGTQERLSVDHIYPESLGGSMEMSNLQTLCVSCNARKGDRLP